MCLNIPSVRGRCGAVVVVTDSSCKESSVRVEGFTQNIVSLEFYMPIVFDQAGSVQNAGPQYAPMPAPQFVTKTSNIRAQVAAVPILAQPSHQQAVYAAMPPGYPVGIQSVQGSNPHDSHPHLIQHQTHQQSAYEAQTIYYSTQHQQSGSETAPVQPQMIHSPAPGSHQVTYLNAGPYGYATVQYHPGPPPPHATLSHDPHSGTRHVLHPHQIGPSGHTLPPQEYVSVMPLQAAGIPTSGGGAYTYAWGQPGEMPVASAGPVGNLSAGGAPTTTMTVLNAHGQPTTIAVAGVAAPGPGGHLAGVGPRLSAAPQAGGGGVRHGRNKNSGGGGGGPKGGGGSGGTPEKNALKGKRGGAGGGGRRGGTSPGVVSPGGSGSTSANSLLDEFRSAKTRNWTVLDIKGKFCFWLL